MKTKKAPITAAARRHKNTFEVKFMSKIFLRDWITELDEVDDVVPIAVVCSGTGDAVIISEGNVVFSFTNI